MFWIHVVVQSRKPSVKGIYSNIAFVNVNQDVSFNSSTLSHPSSWRRGSLTCPLSGKSCSLTMVIICLSKFHCMLNKKLRRRKCHRAQDFVTDLILFRFPRISVAVLWFCTCRENNQRLTEFELDEEFGAELTVSNSVGSTSENPKSSLNARTKAWVKITSSGTFPRPGTTMATGWSNPTRTFSQRAVTRSITNDTLFLRSSSEPWE